jgi:hypothetical protein
MGPLRLEQLGAAVEWQIVGVFHNVSSFGLRADQRHLSKDAAQTPAALEKKSKKMNAHRDAIRNWQPSDIPDWLTDDLFMTRIYPVLDHLSKGEIASALGVSKDYAY